MKKTILLFFLLFCLFLTACSKHPITSEENVESMKNNNIVDVNHTINNGSEEYPNGFESISREEAQSVANEYLISKKTRYNKNGKALSVTTYEYDNKMRLIKEISETDEFINVSIYEYDVSSGLLKQALYTDVPDAEVVVTYNWTEFSYDLSGGYVATTYYKGRVSDKRIYNEDDLMLTWYAYTDSNTYCYFYEYDNNGDMLSEQPSKIENDGSVYNWDKIIYDYEHTYFGLKSKETNMNNGSYTTYEYDDNYCIIKSNEYSYSFVSKSIEYTGCTEYEYISKSDVIAHEQDREENAIDIVDSDKENYDNEYQYQLQPETKPSIPSYTNPDPINEGDTIVLTGIIKSSYLDEYYIEGTSVTYIYYVDSDGVKHKYTDDKVYFSSSDNSLIQKYVGQNVIIKGIASPQSHGVLNITSITII